MIKDLEDAIGYRFQNITLLQNALTHSSYANERWHDSLKSNERLEFFPLLRRAFPLIYIWRLQVQLSRFYLPSLAAFTVCR